MPGHRLFALFQADSDGAWRSAARRRSRVNRAKPPCSVDFSRRAGDSAAGSGTGLFRRDDGDGQTGFHRLVHRRAHDDLRAFALAADLFHHAVDFGHRQILAAHQAHQHGVGFRQRAAFVQQRMGEQFFHDFARARRAGGLDEGKGAFGMAVAHQRAQIVEMNLNQAGPREQPPDAAHALDQQAAGDAERVEHAGVFVNQLEGLLARQANHAVGDGFQLFQALLRLLLAAVAFARERQRDKREHQRAGFLRGAREHGTDAAARAAAQAGDNENRRPRLRRRF